MYSNDHVSCKNCNCITKSKVDNKSVKENIFTSRDIGTDYNYKHKIVWKNAIGLLVLHIIALWGLFVLLTEGIYIKTLMWLLLLLFLNAEGVTIGAHRYYTHKSFKATPFLRVIFLIFQTLAGQNSMYTWCRDHRLHHRYADTDADPHNAKRGFFFSHVGWLMSKKHPYVIELGKRIDMSDLESDWMVMFQKKYYYLFYFLIGVVIPTWVPVQFFGESFKNSLLVCYFFRYVYALNGTWLVNSAAHLYGTRPYDRNLQPVESWFVSFLSLGEGWHNYHHAFPWDYKAAELSTRFNYSAILIKMLEKIRLAYDLKSVEPEMVTKRIMRTGDGTHYALGNEEAKAAVTALGPLHPLNPTYTVNYAAPSATLKDQGLPLFDAMDIFKIEPKIGIRNSASA